MVGGGFRGNVRWMFLAGLLVLAQSVGPQCSDPEPPIAPGALYPSAGVSPPVPRIPWVLLHNATETFTFPAKPPLSNPVGTRSGCPHLDPTLVPWTDAQIWGGVVPWSGDIVLPLNTSILLSACMLGGGDAASLNFGMITIPAGSRLILGDAPLNLSSTGITVQGALVAGSTTCRIRSAINITLVGSRPPSPLLQSVNLVSDPATKGIFVHGAGAALELHGEEYTPTWTRLAAPAYAGDSWIFLQDTVNWEKGQSILVATTAVKDSRDYSETEVMVIAAIYSASDYGMGAAVQLTAPLNYSHYAGKEYQAEVALLSRRILVAGSEIDSLPTDTVPLLCAASGSATLYFRAGIPCNSSFLTGFGGHIMIMGTDGAVGRVEGVLLLRMGQTNYLGRYPFHMHLLNTSGSGSYIKGSTIWKSFYRCVSIHGTFFARVESNVAHDVTGFCYYLEDGVEEQNVISHNLVSLVHPLFAGPSNYFPTSGPGTSQEFAASIGVSDTLALPADATASGFYVTNAYNWFIGNAAIGGWSGFAFPSLGTPINEHRYMTTVQPVARPTLVFQGNSAHSSGYWWSAAGCIYFGGSLTYGPNPTPTSTLVYNPGRSGTFNPSGASVAHGLTLLNDTKIFLCNGVGLQHWGSNPILQNIETHDITTAANFFGNAYAANWLITCRTPNNPTYSNMGSLATGGTEKRWTYGQSIFQSYDIGQSHIIDGMKFRNCTSLDKNSNYQLLQMLTHSDQFTPDSMIATANVTFENSGNVSSRLRLGVTVNATFPTASHRNQNWADVDGSISGRGVPTLLGSARQGWWWRLDKNCEYRGDWTMWACDSDNARPFNVTPSPLLPPLSSGNTTLYSNKDRLRGSGMIFFSINTTAQTTPVLGTKVCSNGGYATIPCPSIGRIYHLGYTPEVGMDMPLNARIGGPLGGFGWVVGGSQWLAPVTLNLTQPQMSNSNPLMLILPYPPGSRFNITAFSASISAGFMMSAAVPSWCFVYSGGKVIGSQLCTWDFKRVGSVAEVRGGAGDTYHFDNITGHLYLLLSVHSYTFLGVRGTYGQVWAMNKNLTGWSRGGISLPYRGGNGFRIITDCGGAGRTPDGMFCALQGGNGGGMPASPCAPGVPLPLDAFDACPPPPTPTSSSSSSSSSSGSVSNSGSCSSSSSSSSTITATGSISPSPSTSSSPSPAITPFQSSAPFNSQPSAGSASPSSVPTAGAGGNQSDLSQSGGTGAGGETSSSSRIAGAEGASLPTSTLIAIACGGTLVAICLVAGLIFALCYRRRRRSGHHHEGGKMVSPVSSQSSSNAQRRASIEIAINQSSPLALGTTASSSPSPSPSPSEFKRIMSYSSRRSGTPKAAPLTPLLQNRLWSSRTKVQELLALYPQSQGQHRASSAGASGLARRPTIASILTSQGYHRGSIATNQTSTARGRRPSLNQLDSQTTQQVTSRDPATFNPISLVAE